MAPRTTDRFLSQGSLDQKHNTANIYLVVHLIDYWNHTSIWHSFEEFSYCRESGTDMDCSILYTCISFQNIKIPWHLPILVEDEELLHCYFVDSTDPLDRVSVDLLSCP